MVILEEPCGNCGATPILAVYDGDEHGPYELFCHACRTQTFVPAEAKSRDRITALRTIVWDRQAARIEGYLVDTMTAQMLVAMFDALSPRARERFGDISLPRLVDFGWKHMKPANP